MENLITFRLCDDDRARLDKIINLLENGRPNCEACVQHVTEALSHCRAGTPDQPQPVNAPAPEPVQEEPQPEPVQEEPQPEPAPEPVKEETAPAVTLEQIQQKVIKLATSGKKAQVREIVNAYAPKVSDLAADKWAEVWDKLTELEG